MANKFEGSIETLRSRIESAGINGKWSEDGQGKYTFTSDGGGVLNWWKSTGTVQLQGKGIARVALGKAVQGAAATEPAAVPAQAARQIFIVHGHDNEARDQLELTLHRLELEPFVLMNSSGEGKTIIEALEGKIGRDYSSDFGIVPYDP